MIDQPTAVSVQKTGQTLEPVHAGEDERRQNRWSGFLVLFLRAMAGLALLKGLYHWAAICGVGSPRDAGFDVQSTSWQTATVFFAIIDLVAAVGLWLAAAWGAVVWLIAVVSMAVVELFFPQVYGGSTLVVLVEIVLIGCYLFLAIKSAREHPV